MITAICEVQDQDVWIYAVQVIEGTDESIKKFEDGTSANLIVHCVYHYFDAVIPHALVEESEFYQWMEDNEDNAIDV